MVGGGGPSCSKYDETCPADRATSFESIGVHETLDPDLFDRIGKGLSTVAQQHTSPCHHHVPGPPVVSLCTHANSRALYLSMRCAVASMPFPCTSACDVAVDCRVAVACDRCSANSLLCTSTNTSLHPLPPPPPPPCTCITGSWDVLAAAVDGMYLRLSTDPATSGFFVGYDRPSLTKKMVGFTRGLGVSRVLGGLGVYRVLGV